MDPIPFYFKSVQRNAISIRHKKPFWDWVNYLYPNSPREMNDGNVYLIGVKNSPEDIEKWLKKNFDKLFKNELNDWHTDTKDWPQKRSFELFKDWFEYGVYSLVLEVEG